MPIYEYLCQDCATLYEEIVSESEDIPKCPHCGGTNGRKLLSASSSLTGKETPRTPGAGDTGCCGSSPGASGCIPGSCCGRA
ncbi:MAG: hypothetical protein PWQ57_3223 [Desulfovibrionales bacterium]|jgi:putative FmdB family regulatory protein|nr:hypothetical protein [Desulfovibrionales bacterium]